MENLCVDDIMIDANGAIWISFHYHEGNKVIGRVIKPIIIRETPPPVDLGRIDIG